MNISVRLDTIGAEETLTRMQLQIRDVGHLGIPDELTTWQIEDMHRHFPNVDTDQEYVSWFTLIWPRSRTYEKKHHAGYQRRSPKRLSALPRLIGGAKGQRPILRQGLFNRLSQRMEEMLATRLKWITSKGGPPPIGPVGPMAQKRIAMLVGPTATKVATVSEPGPRTRERWAKLKTVEPTKVATPATPGPRTLERWAKLRPPEATKVTTPATPGPRTLERWRKLRPSGNKT